MAKFPKVIKTGTEEREALLRGINKTCDAITETLGPKANNVAINQGQGSPLIIHDGVTVANWIDLPDEFEDMGAQLVKEACQKTVKRAGDGTTLTACLTKAIVNAGDQQIKAGVNAQTVKSELEKELPQIIQELKRLSKEVSTSEQVE